MKVSDLLKLVSHKLQDPGPERRYPWTTTGDAVSLVDVLNNALRAIALNRPDATAVTEAVKLVPGNRQTIPAAARSLIEVLRNAGVAGTTPGQPISIISRDAFSGLDMTQVSTTIDNYAYDAKTNPTIYWVYPAVPATPDVYVEMTYSASPPEVADTEADLPIPETFAVPLMHWMLYEIFCGDSSASNMGKAQHHLAACYQALGVKLRSDLAYPRQIEVVQG